MARHCPYNRYEPYPGRRPKPYDRWDDEEDDWDAQPPNSAVNVIVQSQKPRKRQPGSCLTKGNEPDVDETQGRACALAMGLLFVSNTRPLGEVFVQNNFITSSLPTIPWEVQGAG